VIGLAGIPEAADVIDRRLQLPGGAAHQRQELLLQRTEQAARRVIGLGGEHVQPQHHVRTVELFGRAERAPV